MPTYEHLCEECKHEWDQVYSMKDSPPTVCPECKTDGKVKRLISGGSGRGIVRLTGHERTAHIASESRKFQKQLATNENLRANVIGEDKYHQSQLQKSKLDNELVKIGQDAPKIAKSADKKSSKGKVKRIG
jgi:putative FmdB family regulatory protein